jgi:hypothetical protein
MNETAQTPELIEPLSEPEKKLAEQFLSESRLIRTMAPDPDTSIAAARWEKRLMALLGLNKAVA